MNYKTEIKQFPVSGLEKIDLFSLNPFSESNCEFVIVIDSKTEEPIINLKVESEYSVTFRQSESINELIFIGYGNKFIIFDIESQTKIYETSFNGYFGSFKIIDRDVYVASESELLRINLTGELIWISEELGIDGVVISAITDNEISGQGEFDPPGGWKPFRLDRKTGNKK